MALATSTLCVGLLASPAAAAERPTDCFPRRSHTILSTGTARVFVVSGLTYGCLYSLGHPYVFVRRNEAEFSPAEIVHIRVADPYVGFGYLPEEAEGGTVGHIRVVNLRDGNIKHDETATSRGFLSDVEDVELAPSGTVVWIARGYVDLDLNPDVPGDDCYPISKFLCKLPHEVHEADHGNVLLDKGGLIERASLTIQGQTVTWRNRGQLRSASLPAALPYTGFTVLRLLGVGCLFLLGGAAVKALTARSKDAS